MVSEGGSTSDPAWASGPLDADALAELRDRALDQVGAAIILTDASGIIVDWSPGATQLFGWSKDEAVGRTWEDLAGPVADDPDPRRAQIRDGLAEGRSYRGELTVATRDGRRVPILVDGTLIRADDGTVVGRIGIAIDDARRTAAEERFEIAFHDSPLASVITVAPRQLILDVNAAFEHLSGFSRHDAIGRTSNELGLWETTGLGDDLLALTEAGSLIDSVPVRVRHASGTVLEARISARPIALSDGPAYLWMAIDETERLRAEADSRAMAGRLLEAEKLEAIGHLAAGIAHDFNNLMTAITGFTGIAIEALGPAHPVAADLREVTHAASRAAGLTRQLMAFSRRQVIQPERLDLAATVRELAPSLQRTAGDDAVLDVSDLMPAVVMADRDVIEQVLTNLVSNARDALPGGGTIRIRSMVVVLGVSDAARIDPTLRPGRYVQLSVSDTGVGMTDETEARAFEPFFTTKAAGDGAGLGLAVVHGIVSQSSGSVRLTSSPGAGTTVTVTLPEAPAEATGDPTIEAPPGMGAAGAIDGVLPSLAHDPVALVVDDEPAIRSLAARILERAGYTVVLAEDGRAALDMAPDIPVIDVLLTDLTMPRLGGVDLARALIAQRPGLPVVYMSGYGEGQLADDGVLSPDVRLLHKPFDVAALTAAVDAALAGRG